MAADLNRNVLNRHTMIKHSILSSLHAPIEHPTLCSPHANDMLINIQLLYDPNTSTEPDLWDGNFHPILLYSSIEYLASDSKNIKDSLNFTAKYINNKQIDLARANNHEDFKETGEAIWNLISSIYQSKWDLLIADKNSNSLRQRISAKFISKVPTLSNRNNKSIDKPILVSIKKIPPPIPAKL